MNKNIDLENKLPIYFPRLLELLNNKNFKRNQWRKINASLKEELKKRRIVIERDKYLKVETNIYDIIVGLFERRTSEFGYYQYINILFDRLTKNLTEAERTKLRHTLYSVFIHLDHKYRNFIGELSVLNNIRVNYKNYRLVAVEKSTIVEGKTADFTFQNLDTSELELVEVVNIHAYDKTEDFDLKKFVIGKIEAKIHDKTNGNTNHKPFQLIPVFWGMIPDMRRLGEIFKNENVGLPRNVAEPLSLCSFDGPNYPVHRFARVSEMFTDGLIEVIPFDK